MQLQKQTPTSLFFSKLKIKSHERKTSFYTFKKQRHAMHLRLNPNLHAYKATTYSFYFFFMNAKENTTYKLMHASNTNKVNRLMLYTPQTGSRIP